MLRRKSLSRYLTLFACVIFICIVTGTWSFAQDKATEKNKTFSLYLENDILNQTDRQYTNGFKLTWISQDLSDYRECKAIPEWSAALLDKINVLNHFGSKRDVSFSFGQNIYTPSDTKTAELIEDDRPYAGVAYVGVGFHSIQYDRMDTLEFYLGIVGPHSYAEETQKIIHELIGNDIPQGWEHQLQDELILGITYEHKRKIIIEELKNNYGYDVMLQFGGGLGNAYTYANCGSTARFGKNLPHNFSACRISPVSCSSNALSGEKEAHEQKELSRYYLFLSVDGRVVLRDIFLDGNTFKKSHSVEKEPLVADLMIGFAFTKGRFTMSLANIYQTKLFKTQEREQRYSSVNFTFSY